LFSLLVEIDELSMTMMMYHFPFFQVDDGTENCSEEASRKDSQTR